MTNKKEILNLFKSLKSHADRLTPGQADFISSTRKYFKRNGQLSERQLQALHEILKWLPAIMKTQTS